MKLEKFVSNMMRINSKARLWHWGTDIAQHHVTFEQFLNQNILNTDSFVESMLGNNHDFKVNEVSYSMGLETSYNLEAARKEITDLRTEVKEMQSTLEKENIEGSNELITILDDVVELTSKTLYMLKLK